MGKTNYYLSKGNTYDDYRNIRLTEIFKHMNSLEEIDMYTAGFNDLNELKGELLKKGLIRSNDGIVIGNYKTDVETKIKSLVPIFQRTLVFGYDLKKLGFKGNSYKELAVEVKKYVFDRINNMEFMQYIMEHYYEKYAGSKRKQKAPIYESGDIGILYRVVNNPGTLVERDKKEYSVSFRNFFMNEIYKCERVYENVSFDGIDRESVMIFNPINNQINVKGLHDLLCHIIIYGREYEYYYEIDDHEVPFEKDEEYVGKQITLADYDSEEFLEDRDFIRPLSQYAKEVGLDLMDEDALEKDDYASSFIIDQHRLVKRTDGME